VKSGELKSVVGAEFYERIVFLDRTRAQRPADIALPPPDRETTPDFDVVFAGGGLSLLIAVAVASRGLRVAVCERTRAGVSHREWNASRNELEALVHGGIVTAEDLKAMIVAKYQHGTCRFFPGPAYPVANVLDHAVDAGALLANVRSRAESLGVTFIDGAHVTGIGAGENAVRVSYAQHETSHEVVARVVVDARGASSPYAVADLVCPTVGGVMRGMHCGTGPKEVDPSVGEILVTTEGIENGRQHVWELFPGRSGEASTYLFYYANRGQEGSLEALYARFFDRVRSYKKGDLELVRPTFGFIPGWSRLSRAPMPPSPRVVLVGDAAARHSPLTFCGFGAMLRSFAPAAHAIVQRVASDSRLPHSVVHDTELHSFTGPLAKMMASGHFSGNELNDLLDAAFASLHGLGGDAFGELLRDEMAPQSFYRFLLTTSKKRPRVYREVVRDLGVRATARWGAHLVREMIRA